MLTAPRDFEIIISGKHTYSSPQNIVEQYYELDLITALVIIAEIALWVHVVQKIALSMCNRLHFDPWSWVGYSATKAAVH